VSDRSSTTGLTETELIALLGAADADGPRSAALITLLALNGLRVGEALALDAPWSGPTPAPMSSTLLVTRCVLRPADAASTRRFTCRATVLNGTNSTVGLMSTVPAAMSVNTSISARVNRPSNALRSCSHAAITHTRLDPSAVSSCHGSRAAVPPWHTSNKNKVVGCVRLLLATSVNHDATSVS